MGIGISNLHQILQQMSVLTKVGYELWVPKIWAIMSEKNPSLTKSAKRGKIRGKELPEVSDTSVSSILIR